MDKRREEFEAWASRESLGLREDGESYYETCTHFAWQAWQAAQQAQWLPIETAPSGEAFLAVLDCAGERTICTMRLAVAKQKNSVPDSGDFHRERVTHWMPLPPEPHAV